MMSLVTMSMTANTTASASVSTVDAPASGLMAVHSLHTQRADPVKDTKAGPVKPDAGRATSDPTVSDNPARRSQVDVQQERQVQQVIAQLKSRDAEVRVHEQAHLSAAGQYATGGASYVYQVGPDGRRYAIGGEVGIDTAPVAGDPEATLQKAWVVQRAALAPAQPSAQDMKVAALAAQMANQARLELTEQMREQQQVNEKPVESEAESELETADAERAFQREVVGLRDRSGDGPQALTVAQVAQHARGAFDLRLAVQPRALFAEVS